MHTHNVRRSSDYPQAHLCLPDKSELRCRCCTVVCREHASIKCRPRVAQVGAWPSAWPTPGPRPASTWPKPCPRLAHAWPAPGRCLARNESTSNRQLVNTNTCNVVITITIQNTAHAPATCVVQTRRKTTYATTRICWASLLQKRQHCPWPTRVRVFANAARRPSAHHV